MRRILFCLLFTFKLLTSNAQTLSLLSNIKVMEGNDTLIMPFGGGLNSPQFSKIDFDNDGKLDLLGYDKSCSCLKTYINTSSNTSPKYEYTSLYQSAFPKISNWILLRDFDCDGKVDIFTSKEDSIIVYPNTSTTTNLSFGQPTSVLYADNAYIFVSTADIPAIDDIDNDGDLDILCYDTQGFYVVYYKNLSKENYNDCAHLEFTVQTHCWGKFREDGLNNIIYLNENCPNGVNTPLSSANSTEDERHSGSTIATFDQDGNGVKDALIGDLSFSNMVYLHNSGTATDAYMDNQDATFPIYDTSVDMFLFPAAYLFDVNNDAIEDLVVAPTNPTLAGNFNNIWYYENVGTNTNHNFSLQKTDFLQGDMIDCGMASSPTFFDYNVDGKLDLVVGNYSYKTGLADAYSDLTLYENVGTNQEPAFQLVTREYLNAKNLFTNPMLANIYPTFGDIDGDGDQDLVIGESQGKIYIFENIAQPNTTAEFELLYSEFKNIDVGAVAMPQLFDLNNDGALDLIVGEQTGVLNYYPNIGTPTNFDLNTNATTEILGQIDVNPICCLGYSSPHFFKNANNQTELLLGTENGTIWHYNNIDNNLTGAFSQISNQFGEINVGYRSTIASADINNDGYTDYAIGNVLGGVQIYTSQSNIAVSPSQPQIPTWNIYPNPSNHSKITIEIPTCHNNGLSLEIFSIEGKMLLQQSLYQPITQLNIPNLTKGIYLIKIGNEVKKWVLN